MNDTSFKNKHLKKRYRAEARFKAYGIVALGLGLVSLVILLTSVLHNGFTSFEATYIDLEIDFNHEDLGFETSYPTTAELEEADFGSILFSALYGLFPQFEENSERKQIRNLVSTNAVLDLGKVLLENPQYIDRKIVVPFIANSWVDQLVKGNIDSDLPENSRGVSDLQLALIDQLQAKHIIKSRFNWNFIFSGDSRFPEIAGIGGALVGSFFTILVCFLTSFPVGLAAAVYLEQFAPKNRWTDLIEVNINNLAAVPSIIFGLLGLAIFLNYFNLPRSTPLVGGLVLALMTLPTIIVASRAALKAVPASIKDGALALGASEMQAVFHHVVPLAIPGTLTGTIIGLARALGETAPLLMIGMVAFIVDVPRSPLDPSAVLPVQIYLWAESAERGFVEKTSGAIVVIIGFLIIMNLTAVLLRNRFERRW